MAGPRMLFTANPQEQDRFLHAVQARMGRNRFEQFTRLMEQAQLSLMPGAASSAGSTIGPPTP